MKKIINFSQIRVEANYALDIICHYSLFINDTYEGTYATKEELEHRLLLLQITELNRGLNKVWGATIVNMLLKGVWRVRK